MCDNGKTWDVDTSTCVVCGYGKYRNKLQHNLCQECQNMFTTLTVDGTTKTQTAVGFDQCAREYCARENRKVN